MAQMIQFTTTGVEVTASPTQLAEMRGEFEKQKLVHLPALLSPELAEHARLGIERDGFETAASVPGGSPSPYQGAYQGNKVGEDLRQGEISQLIAARTNDPALLQFVATIGGSASLARCIGRVFRLGAMAEDLAWHTDAEGGRVLDLIINLNVVPHAGGLFQMRDAHTHEILNEVGETAFGDGMLIRISPDLEHHYKAITGPIPKVTFSGWFVPKGP
jgi:hypothetical protein